MFLKTTEACKRLLQAMSASDRDELESIWRDKHYSTFKREALMQAIKYNHEDIFLDILLENTHLYKSLEFLNTIVVKRPEWTDVIKRLLDAGAENGRRNKNEDTWVHIAFNNHPTHDVIDILLRRYLEKSSVNLVNVRGISLFHIACTRPNLDVVEKLLDANPTILNAASTVRLYTSLHYAVKYRRHEIVRFLIERGADFYKVDLNGSTPLHWALVHQDVPMIDLIMSVDLRRENFVNKYGLSHFMAACGGSNADVVEAYLQTLLEQPDVCIGDLIRSKVPSFHDYTGFTPLHFAVKIGCVSAIELLLCQGADCCNIAGANVTPHSLADIREDKRIQGLLRRHCDLATKCREMRARERPDFNDFNKWGVQYEEFTVLQNVQAFKHLDDIYINLRTIQLSNKSFDKFQSGES